MVWKGGTRIWGRLGEVWGARGVERRREGRHKRENGKREGEKEVPWPTRFGRGYRWRREGAYVASRFFCMCKFRFRDLPCGSEDPDHQNVGSSRSIPESANDLWMVLYPKNCTSVTLSGQVWAFSWTGAWLNRPFMDTPESSPCRLFVKAAYLSWIMWLDVHGVRVHVDELNLVFLGSIFMGWGWFFILV